MSYDNPELDDYVDMTREHIAAVRELTARENARIRGLAHVQTVTFGYPDEEDWRSRA